jgi:hypothetical protein
MAGLRVRRLKVYVESNFVLELALVQEQHASCEQILILCEASDIQIIVPAYSIVEPYETLKRHHLDRERLKEALDRELQQLRGGTTKLFLEPRQALR